MLYVYHAIDIHAEAFTIESKIALRYFATSRES